MVWRTTVVICLKNRTFAVSQTSVGVIGSLRISCDLLEKSYFCSITNIFQALNTYLFTVVICLKNRTFAVSQTSYVLGHYYFGLLWFAWKIVLLQYHKHLFCHFCGAMLRCDLLEKSYFCSITNILRFFDLFLSLLWFAWKIVLLQYHKHLVVKMGHVKISCDLLEKSYFCSITNIKWNRRRLMKFVVICLKNRTFAVSQTSGQSLSS